MKSIEDFNLEHYERLALWSHTKSMEFTIQDDPKLLDDDEEIPKS
jgi:hypothetical protein